VSNAIDQDEWASVACERCGRTGLTWGDVTFGHPKPGETNDRRTCGRRVPRVSTRSFDVRSGYQPTLARFAGDPSAYVETPIGARRLEDRRLREGWVDRRDVAPDVRAVKESRKGKPSEQTMKLARMLYDAVKTNDASALARAGKLPEDAPPVGDNGEGG
jgi:hypothetical protein